MLEAEGASEVRVSGMMEAAVVEAEDASEMRVTMKAAEAMARRGMEALRVRVAAEMMARRERCGGGEGVGGRGDDSS